MHPITIKGVEKLAFKLAQEHLEFDQPIPDYVTREPGILESCLAAPFQTFAKRDLYPTLLDKAAILFYLMVKDHPFQNGNKRIALTTVLVFLYYNDKWLGTANEDIYRFAVWVAESDRGVKKSVVSAIKEFLQKNLVSLKT